MSDNAFRKLNPDNYPDMRYQKPLKTSWLALGILKENLKALVDYYFLNPTKKQQLALFIKNNGGVLIPNMTYEDETKRLTQVENQLIKKSETNYHIRKKINGNTNKIKKEIEAKSETQTGCCPPEDTYDIKEVNIFEIYEYCNFSLEEKNL